VTEALSNEQVAELVAAARAGQGPGEGASAAERRPRRRVRDIDFSRPAKFTQEQQRRIERAHESFCRTASTQLSAELRTPVELSVIGSQQLTWASSLAELPQPSVYAILRCETTGTQVLLSTELPLLRRLIDRVLGGSPDATPSALPLTEIDLALGNRILASLALYLSPTWEELIDFPLTLAKIEQQSTNLQLASPSEPTLMLTHEAKIGESSETFALCVPWRAIEPVAQRLSGANGELGLGGGLEDAKVGANRALLSSAEIEVRAEVAATELSLDELLALAPGSVIQLGSPVDAGVSLYAGPVPIFRAQPGRRGERRAVQIVAPVTPVVQS
jgi:flagellar motor switch protein FliM